MKPLRTWIATLRIQESFSSRLSRTEILELLSLDTPDYIQVKIESLTEERKNPPATPMPPLKF